MDSPDEFEKLLNRLDRKDQAAFDEVYERCIGQVVAWAARRIGVRLRNKIDPESVALSAMNSFFQGFEAGDYDFEHWGGIMKLLATITLRKALNRVRSFRTARRSTDREIGGVDWATLQSRLDPAAEVAARDFLDPVFDQFNERDRGIIDLRLHGHSASDVAGEFEVTSRTVARVFSAFLERLRAAYQKLEGPDAISDSGP